MYLAPLNYDRYFKKVFSETRIAKRFLEDFFDVEIIKRINIESFEQVDWEYITVYEEFREKVKRYEQVFF